MKRKTFMIVLGVLILFIIAVVVGVGGGVGVTAAKRNAHKGASESAKPNPRSSSAPTSSSYAPQNYKICSLLIKGANMETKQPIADFRRCPPPGINRYFLYLFAPYSYTYS